jgi:hypothetical protein
MVLATISCFAEARSYRTGDLSQDGIDLFGASRPVRGKFSRPVVPDAAVPFGAEFADGFIAGARVWCVVPIPIGN